MITKILLHLYKFLIEHYEILTYFCSIFTDQAPSVCPAPLVNNANIYYNGRNIATSGMDSFTNGDTISVVCTRGRLDNGKTIVTMECNGESWYPPSPHCGKINEP